MIETIRTRPAASYVSTTAGSAEDTRTVRPLSPAERIPFTDALRGVAILGVLVAYTMWNLGSPPADTWSAAERFVDTTLGILVDAKFFTLFAFLFGAGTAQQWRRVEAAGGNVPMAHARRMVFLLAVGILHALLLRNGDILANYAILGLLLIAARRWPTRRIVVAAIVLAILPYAAFLVVRVAHWKLAARPTAVPDVSWRHYWADNLAWVRYRYLTEPILSWPRMLAIVLAGVLADRARFLPRIAVDRRLALRVLGIALPVAVASRIAVPLIAGWWSMRHAPLARGMVLDQTYWISVWSLAATYIAAFALLCQRPAWPARVTWLRAVGRMTFTNYLLQAVIIVPVCLALGLFDAVTPTRGLLLALSVATVQVAFSISWLRRFRYGPVEWAWRKATYADGF